MAEGSAMRVTIDYEVCTGQGRCYKLAPEVFEADDELRGRVRTSEVPPELVASAEKAVQLCPEQAITLTTTPEQSV